MHNKLMNMGLCREILDQTKVIGKMPKWRRDQLEDWIQEGHIELDYCSKCIHKNWKLAKKSCTAARFSFETTVPDIEDNYDVLEGYDI